jgi:hypothetical protein
MSGTGPTRPDGSLEGERPRLSEVVDGDEVRALWRHTEQEIEQLRAELAAAEQEADEAERRLAAHPSSARLTALPAALAVTEDAPLVRKAADSRGVTAIAPRTYVDRRRSPEPNDTVAPTAPVGGSPTRRRRRSTRSADDPQPNAGRAAGVRRPGRPAAGRARRFRGWWVPALAGVGLMATAIVLLVSG